MTFEGFLFVMLIVGTFALWGVVIRLLDGIHGGPRNAALRVMVVFITLLALGLTVYIGAVLNAAFGYPVPQWIAQILLRGALLGIVGAAIWFHYLYQSGGFNDDGPL